MNKVLQNYLTSVFVITLLFCGFLVTWGVVNPSFNLFQLPDIKEIPRWDFVKLLATASQFLGLPLILGAYFSFTGYFEDDIRIRNFLPTLIAFLIASCVFIFLQFFAPSYLLGRLFDNQWDKEKEKLSEIINLEKNLTNLERLYQKDQSLYKKQYLERLEKLSYDFPTDLVLVQKLKKLKQYSFEQQNQDGVKIIDKTSKLEIEAVELKNKGDYIGAAESYKKLLTIYPSKKEFQKKRLSYQDALKECLAKDINRESELSAEKLLNLRINKKLSEIEKNWRKKDSEEGFNKALMNISYLHLDYKNNLSVRALYNQILSDWEQNEFHLSPLIYQKQFFPQKTSYSQVEFKNTHWSLKVDKVYPYKEYFYLEGVVVVNIKEKKVERYRYGCLRPQVLLLKNEPYTKSTSIKGSFFSFIKNIPLRDYREKLLIVMGVPDLSTHLKNHPLTNKTMSKPNFYRWLIDFKVNFWVLALAFFLLFSAFSWRNRRYLLSPWALLGVFYIMSIGLGVYGMMTYSFLTLIDNQVMFHLITSSLSVIFLGICLVYFVLSIR